MFSTCLFCHGQLGKNDVVECFPVAARLAFDSKRGRLWAVCPHCRRWNLSPLDERLEAIEECERLYRATRARVSTDNIGLAPLPSGVDLIRVGEPLRPEFAAWRYGSQLQWRRRRVGIAAGVVGAAGIAAATVAGPALLAAAAPLMGQALIGYCVPLWVVPSMVAVDMADQWQWERVALRVASPHGRKLRVRVKHLWESAYYTDRHSGELALRLVHDGGVTRYEGERALFAGSRLLARANWLGAAAGLVQRAVRQIDESGDADTFLHKTASRFSRFHGRRLMASYRRIGAMSLVPEERLALEMAVHEETERRALEGELARLADEWKEAEEIAAIADELFVTPAAERRLSPGERDAGEDSLDDSRG
ncbi:MAG: hypothetical protein K0S86_3426 [Geminicoccaceae bacterium]|jgi:hypothetical protein|nr:hypothetical protein [Geminicoccaceae bacterium]